MKNLDVAELRPKLDLEGKYVDFSSIRTALTVLSLIERLTIKVNEPNTDGECRGDCPKCKKPRSFSLNTNTNRFNCFNKSCDLKGGGVIDFASKFFAVTAKEASHLLACAYGIQPYTADDSGAGVPEKTEVDKASREVEVVNQNNQEYVSRPDFEHLEKRIERLSSIIFAFMLEHDESCHQDYDEVIDNHLIAH
jgi:hypothetical protein